MKTSDPECGRALTWLAIISCFMFLSACSPKPEEQLTGKWQEVGGTETLQFAQDGTVMIEDEGDTMSGSYIFVDANRIELLLPGGLELSDSTVMRGALSDDVLTFTTPEDSVYEYKRLN